MKSLADFMFNDGILSDFSQNQEQRKKKNHFVKHCTGVLSDAKIWNTEH